MKASLAGFSDGLVNRKKPPEVGNSRRTCSSEVGVARMVLVLE